MDRTSHRDAAWHDALHERFWPDVYRMLARLVADGQDAMDLAQSTFLTAWSKREEVPDDPKAWLFATARFHHKNHVRQATRHGLTLVDTTQLEAALVTDGPESAVCTGVDLAAPWARLNRKEQQLLQWAYLDDLSIAEIAQVLGIRPGTARTRVARAKNKLRDAYERVNGAPAARAAATRRRSDRHG